MRNISICGRQVQQSKPPPSLVQTVSIEGVEVRCGLIYTEDVEFDPNAVENEVKVLVKKRAFSCNYRDKSFIFKAAINAPNDRFYTVGSDFVAEVVQKGSLVSDLQIGDRVIANNSYPDPAAPDLRAGIPTNHASKEYQTFHHKQLLKIPAEISDATAASFSIGGQTVYSMLRKLDIQPGANVLVTAAKSNTSLFVINALKQYGVNLYATSTSLQFEQELQQLGVKQLIQVDPTHSSWLSNPVMAEVYRQTGGFDYIVDPFFDLHIGKVVPLFPPMRGGKYVTCGLYDQYSSLIGQEFQYHGLSLGQIFSFMMLNNIQIIGNCLGTTQDLSQAIHDCAAGRLKVIVDAVFSGSQVSDFFDRTYNAKDRFGKVVYQFSHE